MFVWRSGMFVWRSGMFVWRSGIFVWRSGMLAGKSFYDKKVKTKIILFFLTFKFIQLITFEKVKVKIFCFLKICEYDGYTIFVFKHMISEMLKN